MTIKKTSNKYSLWIIGLSIICILSSILPIFYNQEYNDSLYGGVIGLVIGIKMKFFSKK